MILLATVLIPFFKRETNRTISLYVNPDFKICNYNTFDTKHDENSGYITSTISPILSDGGLEYVSYGTEITKKTLLIQAKDIEGFVFPPYIAHFNPLFHITKTLSIEVYESKTEKLLLKLHTWRGRFSDGYALSEVMEKFKEGLIQAGWKEKKAVPVSEAKQSGN